MNIRPFLHHHPQLDASVYVDATAVVIGDVVLKPDVNVWMNAVIRGDTNAIRIGRGTNIQDLSMLHTTSPSEKNPQGSPLNIGEDVTVGHHVNLHGCTIGNRVLVGIGSIILDDAVIEDDCMIGAGSLVPPRKILKSGWLYMGSPVKPIRALSEEEKAFILTSAQHYVHLAKEYLFQ